MNLFEIALAHQVWACRGQGTRMDPLERSLPSAGAVILRLAAILTVFAVSIAVLELAGDRYGQRAFTGSTAAASRQ